MDYVKVSDLTAFADKTHITVKLLGRLVGIIKRQDGSFLAVEAGCKHQGANLLENYTGGQTAVCSRHGWKYDLESGECLNHESLPLKKYQVKCEGDELWVTLLPVQADD